MPVEHRFDPTWLEVVAVQLSRSGSAALTASGELLAHYGDTGETLTQQALDGLVERAADTLGTLAESLAEASHALQEVSPGADRDA